MIFQRDAMDCGPTCLAMVVKHYGHNSVLEQIREDCALGKSGVSLQGISKAAEKRDCKRTFFLLRFFGGKP